jgi:MerR family transcriptional regulator, light-induced transcriptional regulator
MDESTIVLSPREAAGLLHVHESTLKRWCDSGALPCVVTPGGHRRIELEALLDYAASEDLPVPVRAFGEEAPGVYRAVETTRRRGEAAELVDITLEWALRGSGALLHPLLRFLFDQGMPVDEIMDLLVGPLARRVGEQWSLGCLGVGEEHVISQLVLDALFELRRRHGAGEKGPTAIVACSEGNRHELGAQMVRLVLEAAGWRVIYLGADVPVVDLALQQRRFSAELVCVSLIPPQVASDAERLVTVLAPQYDASKPYRLVLGGAATQHFEPTASRWPFLELQVFHRIALFQDWLTSIHQHNEERTERS